MTVSRSRTDEKTGGVVHTRGPVSKRKVMRGGMQRMPETATRVARAAPGGVKLSYIPGLDGLRALAVVAVLLYHTGLPWIPGGFLGVDVFFVISGYLITSLLLVEWGARGRVDLKAFWLARARRLLPAAFLVIAASLAFAVLFLPDEVAGLRSDALASFGYVTNWYLIFEHESYFEAVGRPSLLRHLWSLAVEEQFYVLWPLLLAVGLGLGATRYRRRRLLFGAIVSAAASSLLMALLYLLDADPSRVYYGTDTRATGLLVGAALAFLWEPARTAVREEAARATIRHRSSRRRERRERQLVGRWAWIPPLLLDAAGLAALGGLVWACLNLGEYQPFLYRGGLALVALATAALVAAVVHPRGRLLPGLLGLRPLRWIGVRSYGIYLWHWPVFMVTRPQLDVPIEGWPLLALQLTATVGLAAFSYRYVEAPIRKGALGRAWKTLREARGTRRWWVGARLAGVAVPVVACCVAIGLAAAQAEPPKPPSYLSQMAVRTENPVPAPEAVEDAPAGPQEEAPSSTPKPDAEEQPSATGEEPREGAREATPTRPDETAGSGVAAEAPAGPVTAVGDSVMLGAVDALPRELPNIAVLDARGNRQAQEALGLLRQLRATGKLGDVVVVHIGNNGVFTAEEFDEMMRVLSGVRKVLVVNTTVPPSYSWAPNNEILAAGVGRHPDQAVLVDWHTASAGHPEYFWDGMHLTPEGSRAYADLISAVHDEQNAR